MLKFQNDYPNLKPSQKIRFITKKTNEGLEISEIAKLLHMPIDTLITLAKKHNLQYIHTKYKHNGKIDPLQLQNMKNKGLSNSQIAKKFGVTSSAVTKHLKRLENPN